MQITGYIWLHPALEAESTAYIRLKRAHLARWCQDQGLELADFIVDDARTGRLLDRPALKDLLTSLQPGDVLLVDSLEDLGRRFNDVYQLLLACEARQGIFVSLEEALHTGTPEGKILLDHLQRIPQLVPQAPKPVAKVIAPRSRVSRYNGGACPYGYRIHPSHNSYEVLDDEAAIVLRIFRERSSGRSLRQIALNLTRQHIHTKRGGRWQANTVRTILENIFYTGRYHTHHQLYPDHHPAIISDALWEEIHGLNPESWWEHQMI
jgi:DNA invertase Pin-like site-specific DNA recombinase